MTIDELEKQVLNLTDKVTILTEENKGLKESSTKLQEENKQLLKYNNELFMQVSQSKNVINDNNEIDENDIVVDSEELEQLTIDAIREEMHKGD